MGAEQGKFGKFLSKFGKEVAKSDPQPSVPTLRLSNEISGHILVNREDQSWLMRNVTEGIHESLNPVAAALDAMYKDNLTRSENLLMKDKKGNIQFILGDLDKDGELTVVSMQGQKIKSPNGDPELGCQSAVFFTTPKADINYFQYNFVEFRGEPKSDKVPFIGLPSYESEVLGINLGKDDKIKTLSWLQIPPWLKHDPIVEQYTLGDEYFSVTEHHLYNNPDYPRSKIKTYPDYIPDQKGSFIRRKQALFAPLHGFSIEQEIQHIVQKLPFDN